MADSNTNVAFRISKMQQTAPDTDGLRGALREALKGGDHTFSFFAGQLTELTQLYAHIATGGDSVWIEGTDQKTQLPVYYVQQGKAFLTVAANLDKDALQKDTADGDDYKEAGTAVIALTTSQGTSETVIAVVEKTGSALAGILLSSAFMKKLIIPLLKSLKNFLVGFFRRMWTAARTAIVGVAEQTTQTNAEAAVPEANIPETGIADGVSASVKFTALEVGSVFLSIALIALVVTLALLDKQITNYVRFYNITKHDIDLEISYQDRGSPSLAPAEPGQFATVPRISVADSPPGVMTSAKVISRADMSFLNTNTLAGIGYTLYGKSEVLPDGLHVTVDIPSVGGNSLYVSLGNEPDNGRRLYKDKEGVNKVLSMDNSRGKFKLSIATNQLKGKSPSPLTAEEGYFYEHLIVLEEDGV